ncbi:MAG: 30S ribosomal protein S6, partial [Oscillospiraceae bacterium]
MAKLSEKYEAVLVFSLKKDEEQIKALVAKFSDLIKANGTLTNVDEWGKKKLAYEINYEGEGY